MQIQTTKGYHLIPVRTAISERTKDKCWQVYGEIGTLGHCWGEYKMMTFLWKILWVFLKNVKTELLCDPVIALVTNYPK